MSTGSGLSLYWDDLRFPAAGISLAGLTTPPDVEADTGMFLFDGVATNEAVAIQAQMPHSWKQGSVIFPHVHWSKTTSAAGDVIWFYRYRWWNVGGAWSAWSAPATLVNVVPTGDVANVSGLAGANPISEPTATMSSIFLFQVGRLPGNVGDTYAADARMEEFDIHYVIDHPGSRLEFLKD